MLRMRCEHAKKCPSNRSFVFAPPRLQGEEIINLQKALSRGGSDSAQNTDADAVLSNLRGMDRASDYTQEEANERKLPGLFPRFVRGQNRVSVGSQSGQHAVVSCAYS